LRRVPNDRPTSESAIAARSAVAKQEQAMAAKKKAAAKKGGGDSMIISKSRTKAAAKKSNVGSEFYGALEAHVRSVIAQAEARAAANGRKTLRPQDV
jgi:histone H3/H4